MSINIHPSAVVSESAILGENINIGPFCVVGPEVKLGSGTTLEMKTKTRKFYFTCAFIYSSFPIETTQFSLSRYVFCR